MNQAGGVDLGPLLEALDQLASKKQALEGRLAAIEEKKGTTAPAVYEKVRRETLERLAALEQEADAQRDAAARAREAVTGQRAEVSSEVDRFTTELEEVRFRNSLGEFAADEFQRLEAAKASDLRAAEARLRSVDELVELLSRFAPQPSPRDFSDTNPIARKILEAAAAAGTPAAPSSLPSPVPSPGLPAPASSGRDSTKGAPAPVGIRPMAAEMEALFGSVPPTSTPFQPPPPPPAPARPPLAPEETTQDLHVLAGAPKASFPVAPALRPVLVVKTKDKERGEDTYDIAPGQTLVGRAPENDIIILEESVSRRHARLVFENGEVQFEDLGSANGSFVNGERLRPKQPRKLQDNDVIKLGQLLALFRVNPED